MNPDTIQPNWPCGPDYSDEEYQSEYQRAEEQALEKETEFQKKILLEDLESNEEKVIQAVIDYMLFQLGEGDNIDFFLDWKTIIEGAINAKFEDRHLPLVAQINSAIDWKSEQNAKSFLQ